MLIVPDTLNRNAKTVRRMADPAETGRMLLDYMCRRIGVDSLAGLDVLDIGCGVRFSQAILNRQIPIGSYTGIEVAKRVVDFLTENVTDPRLTYHHVDTANRLYNPRGTTTLDTCPSPLGDRLYDVACMFSVITHQNPDEARATFAFLHRHLRPAGDLFFSALLHEDGEAFRELTPEKPGQRSSYTLPYLTEILTACGWDVVSVVDPRPDGLPIMSSLHCVPSKAGPDPAAPGAVAP